MGEADILMRVGKALYGDRWQTPLSRDLEVTDRTMRNWASGRYEPPPDLNQRLLALLRHRGRSVADLAMLLETMPHCPDANVLTASSELPSR